MELGYSAAGLGRKTGASLSAADAHSIAQAGRINSFLPSRVIYLLYRAALWLAFPFILAYVAVRCARNRAYSKTLAERCGFLPARFSQSAAGAIWIHAVSVGEAIAAAPLAAGLRAVLPGTKIFVSVSTLAGREIADRRLADAGLADGVFYAPFDYVWIVRRVLRRLRPAFVIVLETEIWPNLWRESRRAGAGLMVVNGRISDRAMPRYELLRWFFAGVLPWASRVLAQTEVSRERFARLGCARVVVGGNLKYDFDAARAVPPAPVAEWVERGRPGLVWVAASTMPPAADGDPDEDEVVIAAYQRLSRDFPSLRLILVPRRPERFATAAAALERAGLRYVRRSAMRDGETAPVLLLDSMGELAGVYRLADVVFVGGTFCRRGGHNMLEPAFFGKPVVIGPHMENFPEIVADFAAASACLSVAEPAALEPALRRLITEDQLRAELGAAAQQQAQAKTGATQRAVAEAKELYELALPRPFPSAILTALSWLWLAGGRIKRARDVAGEERLPRPVISIGGIGVGGAGKTPFALYLAELLRAHGQTPSFLTRGYGRISQERCTVVGPGEPAPAAKTGDEAQLLVRSALGAVGICKNRAQAGRAVLEAGHAPSVFVLDDGFQHARLKRDIDIVLIDTLDPFAGHAPIPAGRLREPLTALARADAFVLTRCRPHRTYAGILGTLERYAPGKPVFRSQLESGAWANPAAAVGPGLAFCGLGNPASFWKQLEEMGLDVRAQVEFPDHHRYHPRDARRLAAQAREVGATVLWTTEKDAANFPGDWDQAARQAGLPPVCVLPVAVRMIDEREFANWVIARIRALVY